MLTRELRMTVANRGEIRKSSQAANTRPAALLTPVLQRFVYVTSTSSASAPGLEMTYLLICSSTDL